MHSSYMRMNKIVAGTRELPEEDEAEVTACIDCVDYEDMLRAVEAAWREEIRCRIADLESGRTQGIPLEETLAKARATTDP